MTSRPNTLFYGDNLEVLRKHIPDETIDLVYLDPPFNSKADYNVLFKESTGEESVAQIQAFSDFWHWDEAARHAYEYLTSNEVNDKVADLAEALFRILGKNDMSAYLVMMATRLIELQRVLKNTGTLFLHCDPTASHYLKLVLDSIFDKTNFRNEIVWQRFKFHSDAKRFGRVHDIILFYSKSNKFTYHKQFGTWNKRYVETHFKLDEKGDLFRLDNPLGQGQGSPKRFGDKILTPPNGTHWRWGDEAEIAKKIERGRIVFTKTGWPAVRWYLKEKPGPTVHDMWTDISLNAMATERLGFQTQKPQKLLERIIDSTTNEGEWVLDPFCGCGTAIIAAEKEKRHWIGIDVTYLAINLVKNRLKDSFPDARYMVEGEPRDLEAANELAKDRYQFQWWALSLVHARPVGSTAAKPQQGKKGADEGVDGWIRFADGPEGHFEKVVVQVKSGHIGVKDVRELRDVVTKQKAAIGIFITLEEPTSEMVKEQKATDPYVSVRWGHEYPRIQILTIEQLLRGKRPDMPTTISAFQEAPRVEKILKIPRQTKLELPKARKDNR